MKNQYLEYVQKLELWIQEGKKIPFDGMTAFDKKPGAEAPCVLLFSPHPDDECIIGALPLRLLREGGVRVINVAVTLGSKIERRAGRLEELKNACELLGFDLISIVEGGLENVNPEGKAKDLKYWKEACSKTRETLLKYKPFAVFCPHNSDWNKTHIGTNLLVMDSLAGIKNDFECNVIETEFWAPMAQPNLMVETSAQMLADLMAGTACHVKEVERNPYHLSLPAWMQDNVRRGAEVVGGQGSSAPTFNFATLYRIRRWTHGALSELWESGKLLQAKQKASVEFFI